MADYGLNIDIRFTDSYKKDLQKLQSGLQDIQQEFKDINNVAKQLDNAVGSSTKQASNSLKKLDKRLAEVEQQTKELSNQNKNMSASMDKHEKGVNDLSSDYGKLEKQLNDTQKELSQLERQQDKVNKTSSKASSNLSKTNKSIDDYSKKTKKATADTKSWQSRNSEAMGIAVRSTAIWGLATTAIYGTKRALEATADAMAQIDEQMVGVQKVMGDRVEDFQEMEKASARLGMEYARTMPKVIEQMEEWGRQGKSQAEVIQLAEASLLSANATNIKSADSVSYLVSAMTQFNIKAEDSMMIVDQWNSVANNFANTTAMDLAEAMKEAGKPAENLGLEMHQLIGLTTAMAEATAKSGNRLGRSLRTMFANMSETTGSIETYINGFEEWLATAEDMDGKELDISIRTSEGEYRNMFNVLKDLSGEWENLTGVQKSQVSNLAGNKRRYSDFLSMIENFDTAVEASAQALNSFGSALDENETYMQNIQAQIDQAKTAFQSLASTIKNTGGKEVMVGLANAVEGLFKNIQYTIEGFNKVKTMMLAGLGVTAMVGILANLTTAFNAVTMAVTGLKVVFTALMGHPIIFTLSAIASGALAVANYFGKTADEAKEYKRISKQFNDVLEGAGDISYNQATNLRKSLTEYNALIGKVDQYTEKLQNLRRAREYEGSMGNGVQIRDLQRDIRIERPKLLEKAGNLPEIFPKLDKLDTAKAKYEYVKQVIDELNQKLLESFSITEETGDIATKTGDDFAEATFKAGKEIQSSLIDKVVDLRTKLQETFDVNYYQDFFARARNTFDLMSDVEFEQAQLQNFEQRVSSIEGLYQEIQMMEDSVKSGDVEKDQLVGMLDSRISETKAGEQRQVLQKIRSEISMMQDPMEIWKSLSDDVWSSLKGNYDQLKDIRDEVKAIESQAQFGDTRESLLGTNLSSLTSTSEVDTFIGNIQSAIDKGLKEGYDVSLLRPLVNDAKELKDTLEFEDSSKNFLNQDFSSISGAITGLKEAGKLVSKGKGLGMNVQPLLDFINKIEGKKGNLFQGLIEPSKTQKQVKYFEGLSQIINSEMPSGLEQIKSRRERISDLLKKANEYGWEGKERLEERLKLLNKEYESQRRINKIRKQGEEEAKKRDDLIGQYQSHMDDRRTKEETIQDKITGLRSKLKYGGYDEGQQLMIQDMIDNYESDLDQLEQSQEDSNFVDKINSSLEKTDELISNLDVSSIAGVVDRQDAITKIHKRLGTLNTMDVSDANMDNKNVQEAMKEFGMDKKELQKFMKQLRTGIRDTKVAWAKAVAGGVKEGLKNAEFDTFTSKLGSTLRATLSTVFGSDDLTKSLETLLSTDKSVGMFEGLDLGKTASDSIIAGAKSFASGSSIGDSLMTGIGTALGGPVGGAIGGMVGTVFGLGDKDGLDDKKKADKINENLKKTSKSMKEFGMTYDYIKASSEDEAGFLEGLFGGEDWDTNNLEKAKEDLENMDELLQSAKGTFGDLGSSFKSNLLNSLNYSDFKASFDQDIGKALENSLVESMVTSGVIGEQIKKLAGKISLATEDGVMSEEEMKGIKKQYKDMEKDMSTAYETLEDLREGSDIVDDSSLNASVDNSYEAGSTSNITYHQRFVVEAGAMMGDRNDAESFAEMIEPYISEVIERNQGN